MSLGSHSSSEAEGLVGTEGLAVSVHIHDIELDRGEVLGPDDAVGSAALARDVQVHDLPLLVFHLSITIPSSGLKSRLPAGPDVLIKYL